ncbi:hypothetical protein AAIR29_03360 [Psychrobacter sp. FBL11]|uniref:DUF3251 domain-containing protein n=1 Tax=Psychrobacter saeujeotis TaxID=3143436 RepID=A0ABU9X5H9_9GAMM|nr:hypothetical protein [uncultured Psychrobacter sp.]
MRVKNASRLRYQSAQSACHASASVHRQPVTHVWLQPSLNKDYRIKHNQSIGNSQQGASTLLLALFVIAILVTATIAILLGHQLGYQRGYHALKTETEQATINSKEATNELKDLRISHKVLTNQVATAKQELTISLANLDDLRQKQQALKVDNRQTSQLNDLYAEVIAEQGGMPLQVLGAKIDPLPENAFEYGFDVGMLSEDGLAKSLKVTLTLQDKDNFVDVPLDPARYAIEGIVRIRGRFVMPNGFKPLQVKLSLEAGDEQIEQLYDWKLGNMVDSMPLSLMDLPEVDQSPIEP